MEKKLATAARVAGWVMWVAIVGFGIASAVALFFGGHGGGAAAAATLVFVVGFVGGVCCYLLCDFVFIMSDSGSVQAGGIIAALILVLMSWMWTPNSGNQSVTILNGEVLQHFCVASPFTAEFAHVIFPPEMTWNDIGYENGSAVNISCVIPLEPDETNREALRILATQSDPSRFLGDQLLEAMDSLSDVRKRVTDAVKAGNNNPLQDIDPAWLSERVNASLRDLNLPLKPSGKMSVGVQRVLMATATVALPP